jgi:hypothetical protein
VAQEVGSGYIFVSHLFIQPPSHTHTHSNTHTHTHIHIHTHTHSHTHTECMGDFLKAREFHTTYRDETLKKLLHGPDEYLDKHTLNEMGA